MATKDDITRGNTVRKAEDEAVGKAADDGAGGALGGVAASGEGARNPRASEGGRDIHDDTLQDLRASLAEHIETLQFVNGAISVCINALLQQNADMDADIALVLRRTAGDKLFEATERLELVALALEYGQVVEHCEEGETEAA